MKENLGKLFMILLKEIYYMVKISFLQALFVLLKQEIFLSRDTLKEQHVC
jgi:hypothetical protein